MRPFGSPKQLEQRRRRAIRLLESGKDFPTVARLVGASVNSVFRWRQAFREQGAEGLAAKPTPGRPPKLSLHQKRRLVALLAKGPLALGYSTDLWTTRRVAEVIRRHFGMRYHPNHVRRLLVGWAGATRSPHARRGSGTKRPSSAGSGPVGPR